IYESPRSLFVAGFVGDMCFVSAEIVEAGAVRLGGGEIVRARTSDGPGTRVTLALRPETLHLYAEASECPSGRNAVKGSISRSVFNGGTMFYEVDIGAAGSFDVRVENIRVLTRWEVGDQVVVDFHPDAAMAFAE
ncbi:MAG: TOBE domain-containing protein, partial [Actinomycetota bacterium]|nr:TOBE domain-containing protein [Actinomycetota bacterium]